MSFRKLIRNLRKMCEAVDRRDAAPRVRRIDTADGPVWVTDPVFIGKLPKDFRDLPIDAKAVQAILDEAESEIRGEPSGTTVAELCGPITVSTDASGRTRVEFGGREIKGSTEMALGVRLGTFQFGPDGVVYDEGVRPSFRDDTSSTWLERAPYPNDRAPVFELWLRDIEGIPDEAFVGLPIIEAGPPVGHGLAIALVSKLLSREDGVVKLEFHMRGGYGLAMPSGGSPSGIPREALYRRAATFLGQLPNKR